MAVHTTGGRPASATWGCGSPQSHGSNPPCRTRYGLAALLLAWAAVTAAGPPQRVASVNLCSDQLLLLLAEPAQIASLSHLAADPDSSFSADQARGFHLNYGSTEEVAALEPDLVLAHDYSSPLLLRWLRGHHYPVAQLPAAKDIDGIRRNIREVAGLVGVPGRGERVIEQMDRQIAATVAGLGNRRPAALFYQPNGYTSGRGTLQDAALGIAGWRNLATEAGIEGFATIDLETLALRRPEQIFTSRSRTSAGSIGERLVTHSLLGRIGSDRPPVDIDYRFWICGGPMIAEAIERLVQAHP